MSGKAPGKPATRKEFRVATGICMITAICTVIAAAVILYKGHPGIAVAGFAIAAVLAFAGSLTAYNGRRK